MTICVEIVYATQDKQKLNSLDVAAGTTVAAAIELSALATLFPGEPLDTCTIGIWGRPVAGTQILQEGDRIELYRPLQKDPREARRERARIRPV